jgi:hypothetical protein
MFLCFPGGMVHTNINFSLLEDTSSAATMGGSYRRMKQYERSNRNVYTIAQGRHCRLRVCSASQCSQCKLWSRVSNRGILDLTKPSLEGMIVSEFTGCLHDSVNKVAFGAGMSPCVKGFVSKTYLIYELSKWYICTIFCTNKHPTHIQI